jgi:lipopolysaccharide export system permease protein
MGPFVATFVIAMFFLVMQFLWRYIDDLIGKGLDFLTIGEFLFYVAFNLVPMALPLAILLSSLMTFGALGENNELTALKSSGLSLFKIMRPITYFVVIVCIGAFYFANYAWPWSNLKWKTLYWEILESKPAFQVSEKVFYNEIPNFSIRVEKNQMMVRS